MTTLGTPLSPHATKVMLLGSGELGKEVLIALQRLGVETIAVDRYANAPGQQVAHHARTITMSDAEQLRALSGPFTPSPFVQSVTGVDNVCERAAVLASGGCIRIPKQAGGGVTFALALCPYAPDWRWQNG